MTHAMQDMITLSNPTRLAREVWQESDDHPYSVQGVLTTPNEDCPSCSVSVWFNRFVICHGLESAATAVQVQAFE